MVIHWYRDELSHIGDKIRTYLVGFGGSTGVTRGRESIIIGADPFWQHVQTFINFCNK